MWHRDLGASHLGKIQQDLNHFVYVGGELSGADPIKVTKLLLRWRRKERIANGERVSVDSAGPEAVSVHFIVICR